MPTKTDLAQRRMRFLLERMPDKLRSDVLSDREVVAAVAGVHHPVELSSDVVISREELFAAFRDLFDGQVCDQLTGLRGDRIDAAISLEPDGVGAITVGQTRWLFESVDLLARDPERRMAAFERLATARTFATAEEKTWRGRLRSAPLDDESFSALLKAANATPETFAGELKQALDTRGVSQRDLLPDDASYWDRLIPTPGDCKSLPEYIATDLDARRRAWVTRDLQTGLRRSSLEFAAPGLVPDSLLDPHAGGLSIALASAADLDDHFALVGAFEICASRVGADARLVSVGTRLLERLFSPMENLEARCSVFGSAFMIATARLATHEDLRRRPVYWRRLAAAAHASLVARTSAIAGINHREVMQWAIQVAGWPFQVSCLLDRAIEPRWRPEWIAPRHLMANAIIRVLNAWRNVDEAARPDDWVPFVKVGERWIEETGSRVAAVLPAVLEGGLQRGDIDLESLPNELAEAVQTFIADPTPKNAVGLASFVFTWGVSDDLVAALRRTIDAGTEPHPPEEREVALIYGAHLAVERKDAALADTVAQASLQTALYSDDRILVRKALLAVIECTGAYPGDLGNDLLTERLERLALWRRNPLLPSELSALVPDLKLVRPSLRTKLARPLAALALAPAQI